MRLFAALAACAAALPLALARPASHLRYPEAWDRVSAASGFDKPRPIPGDWRRYSNLAGFAEQTYCDSELGQKVGDGEILWMWGDGDSNQRVYLFNSASSGLAVAWEGTNQTSLASIINNVDLFLVDPDPELIPQALPGAKVFDGYQKAYKKAAPHVLAAIKKFSAALNISKVTVTGDSLGAGIAMIGMFHIEANLPHGIDLALVFGPPRVGNPQFANTVDHVFLDGDRFLYAANFDDIVVHVPPRILGYQHPSGQIWINPANSTSWLYYPGQENIYGANSVWYRAFSIPDHTGIYFNTEIGGSQLGKCPAEVGAR
ncbi:hypothetical protein MCUN1_003271 [Malassezia cuniculi]|uniref:Fungal lipase-type domain-containing protein n=1 Tax=Malassezia cuniculi TaxID=948313 RepID=A0AAF0EX79_9BASI|nr:hypothetical protein MCUN1_003271 [Malassezia cuniculi]